MGPLFTTILANQFTRLRDGDRFFYLNESWNSDELNILQQGNTLAKVIEANTDVTNLQSDVFLFTGVDQRHRVRRPRQRRLPPDLARIGVPGITVQLQDTSGDVLATTRTNLQGQYTFTQQSGPSGNPEIAPGVSATGDYQIVLVLPSYLKQTTPTPNPVHISRGGINVTGVDFGIDVKFGSSGSLSPSSGATTATIAVPSGTAGGGASGTGGGGATITVPSGGGATASAIVAASATGSGASSGLSGGGTASSTGGGAGSAVGAPTVQPSGPVVQAPGADRLTPLGPSDPDASAAGDPLAGASGDDPDAL